MYILLGQYIEFSLIDLYNGYAMSDNFGANWSTPVTVYFSSSEYSTGYSCSVSNSGNYMIFFGYSQNQSPYPFISSNYGQKW